MDKSCTLLFDLDNTLTPPRQKMSEDIKLELLRLLNKGYKIGIVTGSPKEYVLEQLDSLNHKNLSLFACNGTSHAVFPYDEWKTRNMEDFVNINKIRDVLNVLLEKIKQDHSLENKGVLIQERGSMVNFCPIGRSADKDLRDNFVVFDKENNFRENILKTLKKDLQDVEVTIVLGGQTSFDIYPHGWDKTFMFKHLKSEEIIYFGDAFHNQGNDSSMLGKCVCINVNNVEETLDMLKKMI